MVELGTLADEDSSANAINDTGVAVVRSWVSPGEHHAVLFMNNTALDLNDLVEGARGFSLTEATGINNRFEIVGFGHFKSEVRAFKLVSA